MDDTSSTISEGDPDYKYILDILYGPTVVCGIVKYRTGRIYHIKGNQNTVDNYYV